MCEYMCAYMYVCPLHKFSDAVSAFVAHVLNVWMDFGSVTGQGASTTGLLVGVGERYVQLESGATWWCCTRAPGSEDRVTRRVTL